MYLAQPLSPGLDSCITLDNNDEDADEEWDKDETKTKGIDKMKTRERKTHNVVTPHHSACTILQLSLIDGELSSAVVTHPDELIFQSGLLCQPDVHVDTWDIVVFIQLIRVFTPGRVLNEIHYDIVSALS
jgi:hypothetical protein